MAVASIEQGLSVLDGRARLAKIALHFFIAICLPLAAFDVGQISGSVQIDALPSQAWVDALSFVGITYTVLFVLAVIAVSLWIYRAHQNLFDAGFEGLHFTGGVSVGWFFVPFACLLMPLKAMREAWYVSHGEMDDPGLGFPPLLLTWWILWLAGNFLAYGQAIPAIELISTLASIGAAWTLSSIIQRINAAQMASLNFRQTFA